MGKICKKDAMAENLRPPPSLNHFYSENKNLRKSSKGHGHRWKARIVIKIGNSSNVFLLGLIKYLGYCSKILTTLVWPTPTSQFYSGTTFLIPSSMYIPHRKNQRRKSIEKDMTKTIQAYICALKLVVH